MTPQDHDSLNSGMQTPESQLTGIQSPGMSRRQFLGSAALTASLLAGAGVVLPSSSPAASSASHADGQGQLPWYQRIHRIGQINLSEKDPESCDVAWWRGFWKRNEWQGVILNAGGIFAYYPSKYPLQTRAQFLGDHDLYGEMARAAHEDGLIVIARMDSNRVHEEAFRAHPEWFAVNSGGRPYMAGGLYVSCINTPYYEEQLPNVMREIIERSRPEGFADNSWIGLGRDSICFCRHCQERFKKFSGADLPRRKDWNNPVWRKWLEWNYNRRLELWELNNRVTKEAGGPDCIWVGMISGGISDNCSSFRDLKKLCQATPMLLLDHQGRSNSGGFQLNAEAGKRFHALLGWDKPIYESMAQYNGGRGRVASRTPAEARMWMLAGIAGGISPWPHYVNAYHEDRRIYKNAEPIMRWHKENERYLFDRTPVATVGVVYSQMNAEVYGRDAADTLTDQPYYGVIQALVRARIPYQPVHIDDIDTQSAGLAALVLPDVAAMNESQCAAVRRFVARGGGLLATGITSLLDERGEPRRDFALADLFGAHFPEDRQARGDGKGWKPYTGDDHTYLRLSPELRAGVDGPRRGTEPPATGTRHPALKGFEETDILQFGGKLEDLKLDDGVIVPLTFIPAMPSFPPETAWMRVERTTIPGLIINPAVKGGRVAYLPADLDRRFNHENLPDHGDLLANLIRWATRDNIPLHVEGRGLIDCQLYRQPGRFILHVTNLTSAAAWRAPLEELIPIGPLKVTIRLPEGVRAREVRLLVSGKPAAAEAKDCQVTFELGSVLDHEVALIG